MVCLLPSQIQQKVAVKKAKASAEEQRQRRDASRDETDRMRDVLRGRKAGGAKSGGGAGAKPKGFGS